MSDTRLRQGDAAWWRSICVLRRDGRRSLTALSRETRMPVSTLYERLQGWRGLRRATLLLDFAALGATQAWLLVGGVPREWRDMLEAWLVRQPGVNTVQRLLTEAEFLVEVVLPDARAVEAFVDRMHARFGVGQVRILYVLADVQREGYLTDAVRYPELTGVPAVERLASPAAVPELGARGGVTP